MSGIVRLIEIMARLRDPQGGCPWDLEQDFASIAPYTIEEAYEVADAIARGDLQELRDELGDLLLQVVFHAQIARERGLFDFDAVAAAICDKLVRRHPHVFGGETIADAAAQSARWEELKRVERLGRAQAGALDGVPVALPALTRARKLGRRAAQVGFDWPDAAGPRAKVDEELAELDAARLEGDPARVEDELGDVLFAVANLARHLQIDPERALQRTSRRFASRFAHVERAVRARGGEIAGTPAAELDRLWEQAKDVEKAAAAAFRARSESPE